MLEPGCVIDGRYRIVEAIGAGGMSTIYAAEHEGTRRSVALKLLRVADDDKLDEAVQRFHAEARAASAIGNEHIIDVLDVGVADGDTPYMAMELLDGEDLAALVLREGPVEPSAALHVIHQAAEGLSAAHARDIVHRDVKPANLYLTRTKDDRLLVKVLDFGIAKVRRELVGTQNVGLTRTGSVLGTPMFMAPEQALGAPDIDARADVWGLGAALYTALAGRAPFHGLETLGRLILAICSQPIPPLQDRAPWVEPAVAQWVHRCLQRDPSARFANAGEMLASLAELGDVGSSRGFDVLRGVDAALRARVAPRASLPRETVPELLSEEQIAELLNVPAGEDSFVATETPAPRASAADRSSAPGEAAGTPTPEPATELAQTPEALVNTDLDMSAPPTRPPASSRPWGWIGAALVAAATVALWQPWVPAEEGAAPAAEVPSSTMITATVHVEPALAEVMVDGTRRAVEDGTVELRGAPGSVHSVVLRDGDRRHETEVVLTVAGPRPAVLRFADDEPPPSEEVVEPEPPRPESSARAKAAPAPPPAPGPAPPASTGAPPPPDSVPPEPTATPPPTADDPPARVDFTHDFD